jgi:hypothetical protein
MLDLTKTSLVSALVPILTPIPFHEQEYSYLVVLANGILCGNSLQFEQ